MIPKDCFTWVTDGPEYPYGLHLWGNQAATVGGSGDIEFCEKWAEGGHKVPGKTDIGMGDGNKGDGRGEEL